MAAGVRPDRIWIIAALKVAAAHADCPVAGEQRIELAGALERMQVVAAADMHGADENLRHRHAAIRPLDHLVAPLPIAADVDFVKATPLRFSRALAAAQ